MNNTLLDKVTTRRALISTFFISILAGGAFQKSLELFFTQCFIDNWTWEFAIPIWGSEAILLSLLVRFYIGNLLHLKSLEDTRQKSNIPWLFDFTIIIIQFSILYFAAMCFKDLKIYLFFVLISVLLLIDCIWILSMYFLGKFWKSLERSSIPWKWFYINFVNFISLLLLFYFRLLVDSIPFASIKMMSLIISIFLISAIVDVVFADEHLLFPERGWKGLKNARTKK
jgi:hypothetical protein